MIHHIHCPTRSALHCITTLKLIAQKSGGDDAQEKWIGCPHGKAFSSAFRSIALLHTKQADASPQHSQDR